MPHILIVDDDQGLATTLKDALSIDRHEVETAFTRDEAHLKLKLATFDLFILDWNLPDGEGVDICRHLRQKGIKAPVLMLTAKSDVMNKVESLDAGADDYLVKPFNVLELAARVRALLRRGSDMPVDLLHLGSLLLDSVKFRITHNGDEILFRPREFAILEFLMRHPNKPYSAEQIMSHIWSSESESSSDVVRVHINKIRKKLSRAGVIDPVVETIAGLGYRLRSGYDK